MAFVEISDWNDLDDINLDLTDDYVLVNDIDENSSGHISTGAGWTGIGSSSSSFSGTFDGQNYTISDLYINSNTTNYTGLFAYIDGGSIKDVSLFDVDVYDADGRTAALVGISEGISLIENCHITGGVGTYTGSTTSTANGRSGGLVGWADGLTVENCSVKITFLPEGPFCGTFIGRLLGGTVKNSYSESNLNVAPSRTTNTDNGGFIGLSSHSSVIENCYFRGDANLRGGFGGLFTARILSEAIVQIKNCYAMGDLQFFGTSSASNGSGFTILYSTDDDAYIDKCYSVGTVANSGLGNVFAGAAGVSGSNINNSFYDSTVESVSNSGSNGFAGKTTAEMRDIDTYTDIIDSESFLANFTGTSGNSTLSTTGGFSLSVGDIIRITDSTNSEIHEVATVDTFSFTIVGTLEHSYTNQPTYLVELREDLTEAWDMVATASHSTQTWFLGNDMGFELYPQLYNERKFLYGNQVIDTFEDGNYTANPEWTVTQTGTDTMTVGVTTTSAKNGTYGLRLGGDANHEDAKVELTNDYGSLDISEKYFTFWYRPKTNAASGGFEYRWLVDANNYIEIVKSSSSVLLAHRYNSSFEFFQNLGITLSNDTWYFFELIIDDGVTDEVTLNVYNIDGRILGSTTQTLNSSFNRTCTLSLNVWDDQYFSIVTHDFDDITYGFDSTSGVFVGIKIGGTFVDKPLMIKKSGVFEPASGLTVM